MAFLDFGLNRGLAYRYNADKDIDNANQMYLLKRQARIDQENKAKLLGDKFKFGHADDPFNEARLDQFTDQKMIEIGKFVHDNPNFERNAAQWGAFQRMTNELLDNPIVTESMRVKAHRDAMNKYIQETPGAEELPDIQRMQQQYSQYTKHGSITDNPADRKEFMFYNPDDLIDTGSVIAKTFSQLQPNQIVLGPNGSYKGQVYQEDLYGAADLILKNMPVSMKLTKEWNAVKDSEEMKRAGVKNIRDYVIHTGKGFIPSKYDPGYRPLDGGGSGSGSQNNYIPADIWKEKHVDAYGQAKSFYMNGRGNRATFSITPEEQADMFTTKQNGKNMITLKNGIVRGKDGTKLDAMPVNGTYQAIPTGEMSIDYIPASKNHGEDARYYQTMQIVVPYAEAYKLLKEQSQWFRDGSGEMFNENAAFTFNNESFKTGDINLTERGSKMVSLHDDEGRPAVGLYIDVPYDPSEKGLGEKFNHYYGAPGNQFGTDKRNYSGYNEEINQQALSNIRQGIAGKKDTDTVTINGETGTVADFKGVLKANAR